METNGSRIIECGGVVLGCIRPEARDLLDAAVAAWKRDHPGEDDCAKNVSAYGTLYWLFRWSGVIRYDETSNERG